MDYKETAITGKSWRRASRVIIDNPLGGTPSVMFVEDEAINTGTDTITRPVANLSSVFDPANSLHVAIYNKLNELYTLLREERDARI